MIKKRTLTDQDYKFSDREQLRKLLKKALFFEETTLASGKKSNYYIDARLVTLSSEGSLLVARVLLNMLEDYKVQAIGGLTLGADPIAGAIATLSGLEEIPINAFIVRKQTKAHGRQRLVEGPSIEGQNVAVVDDVVTSGNSLLIAAQAAKENGAKVAITTALVDRQEGASELLEKAGFKFQPVFTVKELL